VSAAHPPVPRERSRRPRSRLKPRVRLARLARRVRAFDLRRFTEWFGGLAMYAVWLTILIVAAVAYVAAVPVLLGLAVGILLSRPAAVKLPPEHEDLRPILEGLVLPTAIAAGILVGLFFGLGTELWREGG